MRLGSMAACFSVLLGAASARGDVSYVAQKGQTLSSIGRLFHVSPQAIAKANHLKESAQPNPGQALIIPQLEPSEAGRRAERGTIHAERYGEKIRIRVRDSHGRIADNALKAFQNLMRQGAASFPVDPRLLSLVGIVSDHFGGKTLEVVSGYRTYTPAQFTAHSNHNLGRALDFKIDGVKNEELWAFCRTFRSAGCGYYPNSGFVHLDVREAKASWIDRSLPGEPPQYDAPEALAVKSTTREPANPL
jgi:uncharacterized protein YcbK (DUF882 family)